MKKQQPTFPEQMRGAITTMLHPFELIGTLDEHPTEFEFGAYYAMALSWAVQAYMQGVPLVLSLLFGAALPFVTSLLWMQGQRLVRS